MQRRRYWLSLASIASGTALAIAVATYALWEHRSGLAALGLWCTVIGAAHFLRVTSR